MRIYVSATTQDLGQHRAAVAELLAGLKHEPVYMDKYTADGDRGPAEKCRHDVGSCEAYIGIFGFRYGSGITEMEFREALAKGLSLWVFLLSDSSPEFRPGHVELEKGAEVQRLRELLLTQDGWTVCIFRTKDELIARVAQAMAEAETSRASRSATNLRPFDFRNLVEEKRQAFVGRDWIFREIDRWRKLDRRRVLLILGEPGIGKSAIAAELVHRNVGDQVLAYHFCQSDNLDLLEPGRFVQSIAAQVAARLPEYRSLLQDAATAASLDSNAAKARTGDALERGLLEPLSRLTKPPPEPCLIVVDGMDECLAAEGIFGSHHVVSVLAAKLNRFPGWLRLVGTSRQEPDILRILGAFRPYEIIARSDDNRRDLAQYVDRRFRSPRLQSLVGGREADLAAAQELLLRKADGNFLFAKTFLDGIEQDELSLDDLARVNAAPGSIMHELYAAFLKRLRSKYPSRGDAEDTRRLLTVLVATQEPLSDRQLAAASELHLQTRLPEIRTRLRSVLQPTNRPDGQICYRIFHKSLSDWLACETNNDPLEVVVGDTHEFWASRFEGHDRLARAGLSELAGDAEEWSPYYLRYLPTHLTVIQNWPELVRLLTRFEFFRVKCVRQNVVGLVQDFTAAIAKMPATRADRQVLQLLEESLKRQVHFIGEYPSSLLQCLCNTVRWYAVAGDHGPAAGRADARATHIAQLIREWIGEEAVRQPEQLLLQSCHPPLVPLLGPQLAVFSGHTDGVESVAFSPDGQQLVSAAGAQGRDPIVRVWNVASGTQELVLVGHTKQVHAVGFSPTRRRIVSGSGDGTVRIWDADNGSQLYCCEGHTGTIDCLDISPDGQWAASGSRDQTLRIWSLESGELVYCKHVGSDVRGVAFAYHKPMIAAALRDGTVRLWQYDPAHPQLGDGQSFGGHSQLAYCVAFSPSGKCLASGSRDQSVCIRGAVSGQEIHAPIRHGHWVYKVAFSRDGLRLASGSRDGLVRIWRTDNWELEHTLVGHESAVYCVVFSPDTSNCLASGSGDGTVRVWDLRRSRTRAGPVGHETPIRCLTFSPNGQRLATGSGHILAPAQSDVFLWDVATATVLRRLAGHRDSVTCLAFSGDEKWLASGGRDQRLLVWNCQPESDSSQPLYELQVTPGRRMPVPKCVAFSPGGNYLAAGYLDRTIRLWEFESRRVIAVLAAHSQAVNSLSFAPDGAMLVSGSRDGSVCCWDLSGKAKLLDHWQAHNSPVLRVAVTADGQQFVTSAKDQVTRVWDGRQRTLEAQWTPCNDVTAVANGSEYRAHSDGQGTVVTRGDTEVVARFPLSFELLTGCVSESVWAGVRNNHLHVMQLRTIEQVRRDLGGI